MRISFFLGLAFLLMSLFSCKTHEKLVYFQGASSDSSAMSSTATFTPRFKIDDLLSIVISSEDPESVLAFNTPQSASSSTISGYSTGNPAKSGYLIDAKGEVTLPYLGNIKAADKTRSELAQEITEKLKVYIKNPVVLIQIENYKITVLGDVKSPGTFKIPNERITLLEALGLAGDLKMTGVRKNILVLREQNGVRQEFRVDLTAKDFLNSPVYYLQQNDVVYVEPNATARSESTIWRTSGGIFISLTSLIITTIVLITK